MGPDGFCERQRLSKTSCIGSLGAGVATHQEHSMPEHVKRSIECQPFGLWSLSERARESTWLLLYCTLASLATMSYGVSCMGHVLLLMLTACAVEHPRYGSNVSSRFSEGLAWLMGPREYPWRSGGGLVVKCVASVSDFE